jgi:hypothetical protein
MARSLEYLFWRVLDKLHIPYYLLGSRFFYLGQGGYAYYHHNANLTWSNERCVELAIALDFIFLKHRILEVGNVLNQYMPFQHDVVDLYEKAEGVINEDICDYDTKKRYDQIVCISTLEHIEDYGRAIANMKRLLAPNGGMLVTFGCGQNPTLDADDMTQYFTDVKYMKRLSRLRWAEVPRIGADTQWSSKYPGSNHITIAHYTKPL